MPLTRKTGPPTAEQLRFVEGLYQRHRALLYRFAKGRGRDEAEADDIVSETLLRLFRNAETLLPLPEPRLVDYVVKTVQSVAGDHDRRRRSYDRRFTCLDEEMSLPQPEADPELAYLEREGKRDSVRRLYEALSELSEADRLLLVGKYFDCASDEALARQLGVKTASVRMKLTRARSRAKRILERKEAEEDG